MSLLTFFPTQRRLWPAQAADQSADYLAGGLAALALAEAALKATPLHNAHQQAADLQHELEEVSYQLSRARLKIQEQAQQLAAARQQTTAAEQIPKVAARLHQRRAYSARKLLRKILVSIGEPTVRPNAKLSKI